jgi:dipeptidyl aminopeptidase/acylaminoacyl peptidase
VSRPATRLWVLLVLVLLTIALALVLAGSQPRIRSLLGPAAETLIAYRDGNQIYASRADGSGRRLLSAGVDNAQSPVFSPDGTRVAFLAHGSASDTSTGKLMVVAADGSAPPMEAGNGLDVAAGDVPNFAWSPDSRQIAFSAGRTGVSTIYLAASDGSGSVPLTDASADRDLPSWSPDGTRLAFRELDADGIRKRLRTMASDGTDGQGIDQIIAADGSLSQYRWSPVDGTGTYALGAGFGTPTRAIIWLGDGHVGVPWEDGVGGFPDFGVPFSPDGTFLAILTRNDGVIVADHFSRDPYVGTLRHLGNVADCWVDWSPDGTALYGGSPGDCRNVVVVPLSDPASAFTLPHASSGIASWQTLPHH